MNIADMISSMKLQTRRGARDFEDARTRQPALEPFATVAALVAALPLSAKMPIADRHAITMALLAEHRVSKGSLWSSLLVIAYEPSLRKLVSRIPSVPEDERAQVVLVAFLEVIRTAASATTCENAPAYLKRATELAVVRPLRDAADAPEIELYDEDTTLPDPNDVFRDPVAECADVLRQITELATGELLEALRATAANDQTVSEFVAAKHPKASRAEQQRIWRRLLNARVLLAARARKTLNAQKS